MAPGPWGLELAVGSEFRGRQPDRLRGRLDTREEVRASAIVGRSMPSVDLQLVTVDAAGRVPLRRAAGTLGWTAGCHVGLTLHDGVLRLSPDVGQLAGIDVVLDGRLRVQLPYGVRATTPFRPGTRLIVLTVNEAHVVATAPLSSVIDRFLGGL